MPPAAQHFPDMPDQADDLPPPSRRALHALAADAATGDEPAFAEVHRRLAPGLRRLLLDRARGDDALADDLAQKAWTGAWRALTEGRYDPQKAALTTFVYAVAHKVWLQHLRTGGRADAAAAAYADLGAPGAPHAAPDPADAAGLAQTLDAVRRCLAEPDPDAAPSAAPGGLTQDERWLLRAVAAGASDRVLAQRLAVAPSTVNARKNAAYDKLRRHLAVRGHLPDSAER